MEIKDYITKIWPFKVDEIYLDENIPFTKRSIDNLVSELFAINQDGEKDVAGIAAMTLQKLKQNPKSKINLIERDAGKKLLNEVMYDHFSENYNKNISIEKYLDLFREPALKEIIFSQEKVSGDFYNFKEFWSDRSYKLSRGKNHISLGLQTPKDISDKSDVVNHLSILFEKGDLPKHKPSDNINNYLNKIDEEWPYPLRGESSWDCSNNKKIGSAVTRYFPNIGWYDLSLTKGEFNGKFWSAFLSGIRDSGFVKRGLEMCEKNRYLLGISYSFDAPLREFSLDFKRKEHRRNPDIIFSYSDEYIQPKLTIEGAMFYNHGDINPYLF